MPNLRRRLPLFQLLTAALIGLGAAIYYDSALYGFAVFVALLVLDRLTQVLFKMMAEAAQTLQAPQAKTVTKENRDV